MDKNLKFIICSFAKFLLYSFITALCVLVMLGVTYFDISTLGRIPDSSLTEGLQESLLVLTSIIFIYLAARYKQRGLWLVAGLFCCMFIREWDAVFDNIFHGVWKYIAFPAAGIFIYLALKEGYKKAAVSLADFINNKYYTLTVTGLITVLVVSRIIGMRLILNLIAGDNFQQVLKNFLEEGMELLGYMTIFISAVCYLWDYRKLNK